MSDRVTPLDLARRAAWPRQRTVASAAPAPEPGPSVPELTALLEQRYPEVVHLLRWIGCESFDDLMGEWVQHRGAAWVGGVLDAGGDPGRIATAWKDVLDARSRSILVLESFVFESNLCRYAARAATSMPGRMHYDKTLHVVRPRTALSLWDHALSINWRRPVVFCRALRLARTYLVHVVGDSELTDAGSKLQFSGRLGQAAVLLARFEQVGVADLEASAEQFQVSIVEGNPAQDAVPYLLECYLRLHDHTGNREYLGRAVRTDRAHPTVARGTTWHLLMAEIWLRLADGMPKDDNFALYLRRAEEALRLAGEPSGGEAVQQVLLSCVTAAARRAPALLPQIRLGLRRLNNPFGLGEQLRRFAEAGHPAVELPAALVHALQTRFMSSTEPLHRRLLSDCLRAYVQLEDVGEMDRYLLLHNALGLQDGSLVKTGPLTDELSRIRYADDMLAVAALRDNRSFWIEGVTRLIRETETNTTSCVPLVRLGRELERGGVTVNQAERGLMRARLSGLSQADRWIQAVADGDPGFFYEHAADRAISSPDLVRRNLGGRSNVVTVDDYLGFTNSTLVFKPTTRLCFQRDTEKSAAVQGTLNRMGAEGEFGIIDLITTIPVTDLPHGDAQFALGTEIISVRRFEHGTVLAERLSPAAPDSSCELLKRAARFLAYVHGSGEPPPARVPGVRKEVRKEVKMWLRAILPEEPPGEDSALFEEWWALLGESDLPPQPRRDAHAFNWLVTDTDRIIAVDLEASHWRPMGYELAQLTDDVPALPVDRWDLRREVVTAYVDALARCTDAPAVDMEKLWAAYRASLLVRSVRGLTDRTGGPGVREHGEAMLDELCLDAPADGGPHGPGRASLHDLAIRLRDAWAERRGTPGDAPLRELSEGRRRRISRTLAYHLRHDHGINRDGQGWVPVDTLVAALGPRLKVSADELISVARAVTETRFQVRDGLIRARYGHSRPAAVEYEVRKPDGPLYHCTPTAALGSIFERGEGLRPMTRQWVHLTTDPATALSAGRRHGPSVLLCVPEPDGLECRHAGGNTWLVAQVPPEALRVVPLHQMFATHG
ncbi:RNA 2'-phosphotransferase [Streptomyces sp. TSRI0107]|uniref:RNA 2'-phosphotransferase n=1 Tax=Streptomyces sp. TSRI0107 TaxID=1703942 RepID=UPI0009A0F7BF|nr:RNA 2'-phosphotransferase [Streptomyces sp. TSRI0107]